MVDTMIYMVQAIERNTLRPRENGSYIAVCCSSVGLTLLILTFVWPFISQGHGKYNVT
jgi:hypothetical protein